MTSPSFKASADFNSWSRQIFEFLITRHVEGSKKNLVVAGPRSPVDFLNFDSIQIIQKLLSTTRIGK